MEPHPAASRLSHAVRSLFRRTAHLHRFEGGQMAIPLAMLSLMIGALGVMVVDFGTWYGDRRDAQTDADLAAIAGAMELPNFTDDASASANANAAALAWAASNGVDPSEVTVEVLDTCYSQNDEVSTGVRVTIQRETDTFLFPLVSDVLPTVGTSAVACSGSPGELNGFMPFALEEAGSCFTDDPSMAGRRVPIYGQRCSIVVGGGASSSGDLGQLGFQSGGDCPDGNSDADVYEVNIINGVDTNCAIGASVTSNPGVNVGKTLSGLQARLAGEGDCALMAMGTFGDVVNLTNQFNMDPAVIDLDPPDTPGIDDFFEVYVPFDAAAPTGEGLSARDCSNDAGKQTSPRNVVVIAVKSLAVNDGTGCVGDASSHCYEIQGFVRMYIEGCENSKGWSNVCDLKGGGGTFTIYGRFVNSVGEAYSDLSLSRYGSDTVTFLKE